MDLLYSRYANPMDLIKLYISRERFGEFVSNVINAEYERRKEQAEKDDDLKLWLMYIRSYSNESFRDWKKRILGGAKEEKANKDIDLDDDGIKKIIDDLF